MGWDGRVSLYKLAVLCTVVEAGGVTAAAAALHVSQPVVTAHVRSLEERLGVKLFVRHGRSLRLTDAGDVVYAWAKDVDVRSRQMERDLAGIVDGHAGAVAVAAGMAVGGYLLPPLLLEFADQFPRAEVSLEVFGPNDVLHAAASGHCDFAVVVAEQLDVDSHLRVEPLGREDLVLVTAPNSGIATCDVSPEALGELEFVAPPRASVRRAIEDSRLAGMGVTSRSVRMELGHPEALKTAAMQGFGVALLMRSCVRHELASGLLREVTPAEGPSQVTLYAVRQARKRLTQIQRRLYDFVKQRIAERSQ